MNKPFFSLIAIILCLTACNSAERKAQKVVEKCEPGLVWVYYSERYAYRTYPAYPNPSVVYYNPVTKEISEDKSKVSPLTNSGTGFFITDQSDILTTYGAVSVREDLDNRDFWNVLINYFREKALKYNDQEAADQVELLLRSEPKWNFGNDKFTWGIYIDSETRIAYGMKSMDNLNDLQPADEKSSIRTVDPFEEGVALKVNKKFPKNAYTFPLAYQNVEEAEYDLATEWGEENGENKRTFYILGYEPVNLQNGKGELRTRYISIPNPQIDKRSHRIVMTDTIDEQWKGSPIVNEEGKLVGMVNKSGFITYRLLTAEDFEKEE